MTLSVRTKLFAGMSVVTLSIILLSLGIMSSLIESFSSTATTVCLRSAEEVLSLRGRLLEHEAESFADLPYLKATLEIPDLDHETAYHAASHLQKITRKEQVLLVSTTGRLLADASDAELTEVDFSGLQGIQDAMQGQTVSMMWEHRSRPCLAAVAPIVVRERVLGFLVVGDSVAPTVIKAISKVTSWDVLLLRRGKLLAEHWQSPPPASPTQEEIQNLAGIFGHDAAALRTGARVKLAGESRLSISLYSGLPETSFVLTSPVTKQQEPYQESWLWLTVAGLGTAALALGLSVLVARNLSNPIREITHAAHGLAQGNLAISVASKSNDELGTLARAFNEMARKIEERDGEIKTHRAQLERQVACRTLDLQNSYSALEAIVMDLDKARRDAEAASEAKSQFLANMSHEIRTPMNGVLGMAALLIEGNLPPRLRHFAECIRQSGEAMLNVLNDILDFSKIEAGKLQLEAVDFNLVDVVEQVLELFCPQAYSKKLELASRILADVPVHLRGDALRLRQILQNLVGNAIKFTEKGEIVVTASLVEDRGSTTLIRLEVRDTGIGVSEEARTRLFEAFSQVDASDSRKYGGTGLGLAIARQICTLMGGDIGVESEVGQGATFWFTACLEKQPGAGPVGRAQDFQPRKVNVLVVSNSATTREVLQGLLPSMGMQNDAAATGDEALEATRRAIQEGEPHEVFILDTQLPDTDGISLAIAIQRVTGIGNPKIVLLTSPGAQQDIEQVHAAGIKVCLSKPIRQSALRNCMATLLGMSIRRRNKIGCMAEAAEASRPQFRGSVLIAEDNPINQEIAVEMLQGFGCTVELAANGREAIAQVAQKTFDLVLMDCQMPEMDGFQATSEIRNREAAAGGNRRRLPIIALTARTMKGDRERCLGAGMDDFLGKPFNSEHLEDLLTRWMPLQSPGSAEEEESKTATATVVAQDPAPCVIDVSCLDKLRMIQRPGKPDLVARVVSVFVDQTPGLLERARQAVAANDCASVEFVGHKLRSGSASLGALALSALATRLEEAGIAGQVEVAKTLLMELEAEYARVQDALQVELKDAR